MKKKNRSARAIKAQHIATPTGCTRPESLFGLWSIEPSRFSELVNIAKGVDLVALAQSRRLLAGGTPDGPLPTLNPERPGKRKADDEGGADADDEMEDEEESDTTDSVDDDVPYRVVNGIAVMGISGPMTKYPTSFQEMFGGTATVQLRRALRMASADEEVNAIMFCIDSPGGTVAGTSDLAADIKSLNSQKPCFAYIQDMGCSAAYWAAAQCSRIYANDTAAVGCIGTLSILNDTSKAYEQRGVTVHVVASDVPGGDSMKGAGADGTPVTDAQLADHKRFVNETNDLFVAGVAAGRKMTLDRARALADGRVHVGAKAQALGLVDEISSFDAAMQAVFTETFQMNLESFKTFAAANPDAVKDYIAQGHKAGKAEGSADARTEMTAMLAAFPGREKFAAEQFVAGHDAISAKAALADVLAAENKALTEQVAAQAKATASAAARAATDSPAIVAPIPGATASAPSSSPEDAIKAFNGKWQALVTAGLSTDKAIASVVKSEPQLHAAYLEACKAVQPARARN